MVTKTDMLMVLRMDRMFELIQIKTELRRMCKIQDELFMGTEMKGFRTPVQMIVKNKEKG